MATARVVAAGTGEAIENHRFASGDLTLAAYLQRPPGGGTGLPGVVICHGFPSGPDGGANSVVTFPELALRIATEMGWVAMVPYLRGMDGSEGDFSLDGWRDDVVAAVADLRSQPDVDMVWAVGFGSGASLAICAAAMDVEIMGVGALAAPADWSDWAANPRRLLLHARDSGMLTMERDLLLVHGTDDELVPPLDARVIAGRHGSADLRMIAGAGHHLRHDPRAIATLLGWLDRQRRRYA